VLGPYQFTIGDTSKYSPYLKGGFVEHIKSPVDIDFVPLSKYFGKDILTKQILVADKEERSKLYAFYIQGLLAYREDKGSWPTPGSKVCYSTSLRFCVAVFCFLFVGLCCRLCRA